MAFGAQRQIPLFLPPYSLTPSDRGLLESLIGLVNRIQLASAAFGDHGQRGHVTLGSSSFCYRRRRPEFQEVFRLGKHGEERFLASWICYCGEETISVAASSDSGWAI